MLYLISPQSWLMDAEGQMNKLRQDPTASGDPRGVESQLEQIKALGQQSIAQGKAVDALRRDSHGLITALRELGTDEETLREMQQKVGDIEERLGAVANEANAKANELQTALVQSQGVQEGVDSLLAWIQDTDRSLKTMKPVSLTRGNVTEELNAAQYVKADIESHLPAIDSINASMQDIIRSTSDPQTQQALQNKLDSLNAQYTDVSDRAKAREGDLIAISDQLKNFTDLSQKHEEWLVPNLQLFESRETDDLSNEDLRAKLTQAEREARMRQEELQNLQEVARKLTDDPSSGDCSAVKDKIAQLKRNWQDFSEVRYADVFFWKYNVNLVLLFAFFMII